LDFGPWTKESVEMSLTQQQRDDIAAYLARSESDLLAEVSLYTPTVRSLRGDPLARYTARLRQVICDDWDWCERRQDARFDDSLNAAFAVCDVLLSKQFQAAIPLTLLASILVKRGLDALCNCPSVPTGR
jgi:hypothetical protein